MLQKVFIVSLVGLMLATTLAMAVCILILSSGQLTIMSGVIYGIASVISLLCLAFETLVLLNVTC